MALEMTEEEMKEHDAHRTKVKTEDKKRKRPRPWQIMWIIFIVLLAVVFLITRL